MLHFYTPILYKDQPWTDPKALASAVGTGGIAAWQGYRQGTRPEATEADRAAGLGSAIGGGATRSAAVWVRDVVKVLRSGRT